ncbi:DUF2690 domain-containing protein [Microbacter sp. GSS18]|nr:DUF2690 domain-containing protein [Microbacter sp. GSS18]
MSATDTKERFAADLRKLRLDGGNPTLKRLQDETGISRSVLSEAFAGRALPTARTVDGVVRVCGGDTTAWLDRRDVLAGLATAPPIPSEATDAAPAAPAAPTAPEPAVPAPIVGMRKRTAIWIAAAAFLLGATTSGTAASVLTAQVYQSELSAAQQTAAQDDAAATEGTPASADDAPAPQIDVPTGEDPAYTPCIDDAKVAKAARRIDNALIEIIWSDQCYAGWARLTRYDAKYEGNTVTIAIYPETAPNGLERQEATEPDVRGAYTGLIVRPTPDTLLCAEGSFTVDGESFDLGDPICI